HTGGLVLALAGLLGAATLALEPAKVASAQAEAQSWSLTGSLNTPRAGHTATLMADGKVLVAGGSYFSGDRFQPLKDTELYDPATGKWNATGRRESTGGGRYELLPDSGHSGSVRPGHGKVERYWQPQRAPRGSHSD